MDRTDTIYTTNEPPIKRRKLCVTANNNYNEELKTEFEFQLQQLLQLFPPLTHILTMQNNQHQIIKDLYNVFLTSGPLNKHCSQQPLFYKAPITTVISGISETSGISSITPITQSTDNINNNNNNNNNNNTATTINDKNHINSDHSNNCNELMLTSKTHNIPPNILIFAKQKEITLIRKRVNLRIEKLLNVINPTIDKYLRSNHISLQVKYWFIVNGDLQQRITQTITKELEQWDGGKYHNKLQNKKDCYNKTRLYWNRKKAQVLGNHLFGPILYMVFQFIIDKIKLNTQKKILLFIDIYQRLCKEKIRFDRSMARPLILNACYFKSNKWKDYCTLFMECFGKNVSWQPIKVTKATKINGKTTYEYIPDNNRSQQLHDEFEGKLKIIKSQLLQCTDIDFMQKGIQLYLEHPQTH